MRRVLIPLHLPAALQLPQTGQRIEAMGGPTMGTSWSVRLVRPAHLDHVDIDAEVKRVLGRVVAQMSPWETCSDISAFNRAPSGSWHGLPPDFAHVLGYALTLAQETAGAFDPTVGPLTDAWGFGPAGPRTVPPAAQEAAEQRARVGWSRVQRRGDSFLQPGGVTLDLSAIAKGFAVDAVSDRLRGLGLLHHLVEIGGELRGCGVKPDGQPWWVALESAGALPETLVALCGLAVATSGDSQRFFESAGRRYAHTLDPRTGAPISDRVASVSVLHRSCMEADALATALSVLGPDEGLRFATKREVAARFVVRTGGEIEERASPAFTQMLG